MKKYFALILLLLPFYGISQYAKIYADSSDLPFEYHEVMELHNFIKSMSWTIGNQKIKFGSGHAKIKITANKSDTIFYRYKYFGHETVEIDTFITKLKTNRNYKLLL